MLASKGYSQKQSNAIYTQGRSLVKVKVNIFYLLFVHTLRGTVNEYQAVLIVLINGVTPSCTVS